MTAVVRVLGPFRIRRDDGAWLDRSEWRTSHAVNLVRLLAISRHQARPAGEVAELLWPDREPAQARTALRGALSEGRRMLGGEHLLRRGEELVLADVWIDARAFRRAAAAAAASSRAGNPRGAVGHALEALSYWDGPLAPDEPGVEWGAAERFELDRLHIDLLLLAGEEALRLRSWDTAADLAGWAMQEVPHSERAARTLLRALASLGRIDEAVTAYTRLRERLRDDLGVVPSRTTDEVYREILRARAPRDELPFVGRRLELRLIADAVAGALVRSQPTIVHLVGPRGAGKSRLLEQFAAVSDAPVEVSPGSAEAGAGSGDDVTTPPVVIVRDVPAERTSRWTTGLLSEGRRVVLVTSRSVGDLELPSGIPTVVVSIGSLTRAEVRELAELWLGEPVTDELCEHLASVSRGLPGPLLDEAASLSRALRLGYEDGRLTLREVAPHPRPAGRPLVEIAPRDLSLVEVVEAAGDRGLLIDDETVAALERRSIDASTEAVVRLEANGVLVRHGGRAQLTAAAALELRRLAPERLRRRTSEAVLAEVVTDPLERVPYLWGTGDRDGALVALEAAAGRVGVTSRPADEGLVVRAAELLLERDPEPGETVRLQSILAQVCDAAGDVDRSRAATAAAAATAERSDDPRTEGLRFRLAYDLAERGDVDRALRELSRTARVDEPEGLLLRGSALSHQDLQAAEEILLTAQDRAVHGGRPDVAADAGILLAARVYGPARRAEESEAAAAMALTIAVDVGDDARAGRAELAASTALILAGLAPCELPRQPVSEVPTDLRARRERAILGALVRHDRGRPPSLLDAPPGAELWSTSAPWACWYLRLRHDRGLVAPSTAYDHGGGSVDVAATVDGLYAVPSILEMLTALGRRAEARGLAARAVGSARRAGATLIVPTLLARSVAAADGPPERGERLAELEEALERSTLPGETVLLRRTQASAACLDGDPELASRLALDAADHAFAHGLVFAAADALTVAGSWLLPISDLEGRELLAHARDVFAAAGAELRVEALAQQLGR